MADLPFPVKAIISEYAPTWLLLFMHDFCVLAFNPFTNESKETRVLVDDVDRCSLAHRVRYSPSKGLQLTMFRNNLGASSQGDILQTNVRGVCVTGFNR